MQKRIEIKNMQADVLFSYYCEDNTVKRTVERTILMGINLRGADLSRANLMEADLSRADLMKADLSRANLREANLSRADLSHANLRGADLGGANLRGANLMEADLSGADLSGAYLRGAALQISAPVIHDIHKKIYEALTKEGNELDMKTWHTCETTHCRAGWAVHLAGESGRLLEDTMGTSAAAALIYMASDPNLEKIPDWFASDDEAMADIKKMAGVVQ